MTSRTVRRLFMPPLTTPPLQSRFRTMTHATSGQARRASRASCVGLHDRGQLPARQAKATIPSQRHPSLPNAHPSMRWR